MNQLMPYNKRKNINSNKKKKILSNSLMTSNHLENLKKRYEDQITKIHQNDSGILINKDNNNSSSFLASNKN